MKRYNHNRSNTRLQDMDMGLLVPTRASHCIAGTTLRGGVACALELSPLVHQMLGTLRIDTFAIAIADRLVWDDAEDFYTGGSDGKQRPIPPYIEAPAVTGWTIGSLGEYLGFPTGVPGLKCNAIPFRLYAKWINENIIDPQIQSPLPISTASGKDTTTNTDLFNINWTKDMFTTARPEPILGDSAVIPIATSAPVFPDADAVSSKTGQKLYWSKSSDNSKFVSGTTNAYAQLGVGDSAAGGATEGSSNISGNYNANIGELVPRNLISDLSNTTGVLPDDFNFAMAQQRWKSRRNLFGHRFKDWLAFMGIKYSDRRLDLPSTLAHGKQMIDISGVLQTAPGDSSYVGQMAGRGTGFGSCSYKTYFEEPTTVIHLVCVRPSTLYVNMMPPEWQWEVREDLFTPEYAHVGMVEEKVGTLYPTGVEADDNVTFGWRNRYDEMRSGFNSVCGKFKTTNASYHMGRIFESAPSLNSDFLQCTPTNRVFADLNGPHIEACAIRNTFIERNFVTPDGNPHYA